jgi:luciferase family oxidoreductase group 1
MSAETFPQDVVELKALFGPRQPGQVVEAVPGTGLNVPLWILGSSLYGAQLAAVLGLPYAFASHFAPADLENALAAYRAGFKPSAELPKPYAMIGANVVVADTDAAARRLFTSIQQGVTNLLRGARGQLQPPIDDIEMYWTPVEKAHASRMLACSFVGSPSTVRADLERLLAATRADEIIVAAGIYDQAARLKSYELLADLMR